HRGAVASRERGVRPGVDRYRDATDERLRIDRAHSSACDDEQRRDLDAHIARQRRRSTSGHGRRRRRIHRQELLRRAEFARCGRPARRNVSVSPTARKSPARVVVVEDSLVQRAKLVAVLEADDDIRVVGEATTALEAIALVASLRPDVVTLDLNIPDGGGQFALEQIMANTPTPILVLSSTVSDKSSAPAVEALVGGALLAVPKPTQWTAEFESELRRNVRTIRDVTVIRHPRGRLGRLPMRPSRLSSLPRAATSSSRVNRAESCVVAIAASTGGPQALATILEGLASLKAPVLIVQHIHPDFANGLVDWMARVSPLEVVLAVHGQTLRAGCVY